MTPENAVNTFKGKPHNPAGFDLRMAYAVLIRAYLRRRGTIRNNDQTIIESTAPLP